MRRWPTGFVPAPGGEDGLYEAALADEALADPRVRAVAVTLEKPGAVPGAEVRAALFRTAAPKK